MGGGGSLNWGLFLGLKGPIRVSIMVSISYEVSLRVSRMVSISLIYG